MNENMSFNDRHMPPADRPALSEPVVVLMHVQSYCAFQIDHDRLPEKLLAYCQRCGGFAVEVAIGAINKLLLTVNFTHCPTESGISSVHMPLR